MECDRATHSTVIARLDRATQDSEKAAAYWVPAFAGDDGSFKGNGPSRAPTRDAPTPCRSS